MIVRSKEDKGNILRAAVVTLIESLRSPTATTLIWDSIPIETKSFNLEQDVVRARTRDAAFGKSPTRLSPAFKLVVWIVVVFTLATGVAQIALAALWAEPTAMPRSAFESMATSWKMGFGALIGLLGGKAVR